MGLFGLIKEALKGKGEVRKGEVQKCPNCGEMLLINMNRCPKCGTHVKSMFRRKCPKCKALNELDAKSCVNCKYNFEEELKRAERTVYVCPICSYKMDAMMTRCPACNTRFM